MLGHDIDGDLKKYLLVGAYTWPVMEEAPWDEVEQLEVPPDKDWPTLEEEEALREVEYDLAQDLEAHGEEMSYRPTSDEGEDLEMGEPEEDERQGEGDGDRLEPLPDLGPRDPEPHSVPLPKTPEEIDEHQKAYEMITMSCHALRPLYVLRPPGYLEAKWNLLETNSKYVVAISRK